MKQYSKSNDPSRKNLIYSLKPSYVNRCVLWHLRQFLKLFILPNALFIVEFVNVSDWQVATTVFVI